jgi:hypothetical protein
MSTFIKIQGLCILLNVNYISIETSLVSQHHSSYFLSLKNTYFIYQVFFFFFLVRLGFELWASCLQSRHSTTSVTPPLRFALVVLEMGVFQTTYPRMASNCHLSNLNLPNSLDYRHRPQEFVLSVFF